MAFNRIAIGAVREGSVVAVGHLGNNCYDRKCNKHMFVLPCNSADANLFRLSKDVTVRLDNSSVVEKGLLHEHVR